jgi:excisionase family DNA binding protein
MSNPTTTASSSSSSEAVPASRMTVEEIAQRLHVGRLSVYSMLEAGVLPGLRVGRRWLITRCAYEEWERHCGTRSDTGLPTAQEVTVVN